MLVVVLLGVRDHGLGSRMPVSRAHLTVDVSVLESLHQPQVLIRVPSNRQVVDRRVPQVTLSVNNVGSSVGDSHISNVAKASIGLRDLLVEIRDERDVHGSKSSLLPRFESVLHMGELRVNGTSQHFASAFPELLSLVVEGNDFSGANEGEVKRVEEEQNILALVSLEVDFAEVVVVPSIGNKVRSWFSDE